MSHIAQTVHGYQDGHRLLAAGGELDRDELAMLDQMSDLTGYLPEGVDFDVYRTGYPCGRYYAFSATWLDRQAPRGGAVVTHSLLVPFDLLVEMTDPWAAGSLHHRPSRGGDFARFRQPITLPPGHPSMTRESPPPPTEAALAAYFGQPDRPVVRVCERPPDEMIRRLWALLWPTARRRFAFCTLALRPLSIGRRPFDVLGVPPGARNAFHGLVRSRGWWTDDTPPRIEDSEWVAQLREEGRSALARLVQSWETEQFSPRPEQVPLMARLEELASSAGQRLAAARSQADLMARLDSGGTHPNWMPAIEALIENQPQASSDSRPLWDLTDLVGRRQLREVLSAAPEMVDRLRARIAEQIAHRLEVAPSRTAEMLPDLLSAAEEHVSRRDLLDMVERAVDGHSNALQCATAILVGAASADRIDLAVAALRALPSELRKAALEDADLPGEWRVEVAKQVGDIGTLPLTFADPPTDDDLDRLARAWGALTHAERPPLGRLLESVPAQRIIDWCVAGEGAPTPGALDFFKEATRASTLSLPGLARLCEGRSRGPSLFERAANYKSRRDIDEALQGAPGLVIPVLRSGVRAVRESAVLLAPATALCEPSLIDRVGQHGSYPVRERLVRAVFAAALRGEIPVSTASTCLARSFLLERIGSMRPEALLSEVGRDLSEVHLLPFGAAVSRHFVEAHRATGSLFRVVFRLIRMGLDHTTADEMDRVTDDLVILVTADWAKDDRKQLASIVAHAVRVHPGVRALELLQATFADLHRSIRRGSWWTRLLMWPVDSRKDESEWERWLVRLARERGWSRADVLACAGSSNKADAGLRRAMGR